jgi:hypothetical protein
MTPNVCGRRKWRLKSASNSGEDDYDPLTDGLDDEEWG